MGQKTRTQEKRRYINLPEDLADDFDKLLLDQGVEPDNKGKRCNVKYPTLEGIRQFVAGELVMYRANTERVSCVGCTHYLEKPMDHDLCRAEARTLILSPDARDPLPTWCPGREPVDS